MSSTSQARGHHGGLVVASLYLLALAAFSVSCHSKDASAPCAYDLAQMLALSEEAFDQDLKGGWRAVANQVGCQLVAADLIREYRLVRGPRSWRVMSWHEGQLRAMAGDSRSAIPLMEQTRSIQDAPGWNQYVDATIAFLKRDRSAFEKAFAELRALPKPEWWETNFGTKGRQWPLNVAALEGLSKCWSSSYEKAYGACTEEAGP